MQIWGMTGVVARFPVGVTTGAGTFSMAVDNTALPNPSPPIVAGATNYFQLYFRDAPPFDAGLTDGMSVTFAP